MIKTVVPFTFISVGCRLVLWRLGVNTLMWSSWFTYLIVVLELATESVVRIVSTWRDKCHALTMTFLIPCAETLLKLSYWLGVLIFNTYTRLHLPYLVFYIMRRQFIAIITKIINVLEINLKNENEEIIIQLSHYLGITNGGLVLMNSQNLGCTRESFDRQ